VIVVVVWDNLLRSRPPPFPAIIAMKLVDVVAAETAAEYVVIFRRHRGGDVDGRQLRCAFIFDCDTSVLFSVRFYLLSPVAARQQKSFFFSQ